MLHIALHLLVPLALAALVYRRHWPKALALLMVTMLVDADHLLANPVYDPERCSIHFHPLHSYPAIALYAAAMLLPLLSLRGRQPEAKAHPFWVVQVLGTGLVLHMLLDAGDCLS